MAKQKKKRKPIEIKSESLEKIEENRKKVFAAAKNKIAEQIELAATVKEKMQELTQLLKQK